jgi:rSAM/selenodomain-associated transferase 2
MISIIIPTYNEAANIEKLISYFKANTGDYNIELIVADGGSNDETISLAKAAGALAFLSPEKGRAAQMNYGASKATGDVYYFVHADSIPPSTFIKDIYSAISDGFAIGRYKTKFDSTRLILKINAFFTRFDWFMCMGGDQTLFVTKELFNTTGGFDATLKIMEEFEFCKRARKQGRYKIMNNSTLVSARKYDTNTWWQVQKANYTIVKMYQRGASQEAMVKKYKEMLDYR